MKRGAFLSGVLLLTIGSVMLLAQSAPQGQPVASDPPPTQPAPQYSTVLVLPFYPVDGASQWIGKGIQEDLATELVRQSKLHVISSADLPAATDAAAAVKTGRDQGVSLVAYGSYQLLDSQVRINGQLIDVGTERPIVALKTTGPKQDLFRMEDVLAAEAVAALPPGSVKLAYWPQTTPNAPAADQASQPTQPYIQNYQNVTAEAPANSTYPYEPGYTDNAYYGTPSTVYPYTYTTYPAYTTYPYDYYGYPYYSGYPWGWGGVVIYGGGGYYGGYRRYGGWGGYRGGTHVGVGVGVGVGFHSNGGFSGGFHASSFGGGGFHGGGGHR